MTIDLDGYRSIGEAFAARVVARPDRTALTVAHGPDEEQRLTYRELARRVDRRASALAGRLAPGARVVIALPTGAEFAELYLACLRAGLVAVPAPVPGGSATATERVAAIATDCAPGLVVTTEQDLAAVTAQLAGHGLDALPVEAVGDAGAGAATEPVPADRRPDRDTVAVLQYSSGSTGSPKGVVLTHGAVLDNLAALARHDRLGPDDRFGGWLPLHHDMGLFAQLTAGLLIGAPVVLMPPAQFVRRPVEWFRLLSRHRITVTAAPNFAYDLCLRLVRDDQLDGLDLSALRYAWNGSEPIHGPTMTAFTERFARIGLPPHAVAPAYGMAECTIYVSTKLAGEPPTVRQVDRARLESAGEPALHPVDAGGKPMVGVGRPGPFTARIVDPRTHRELPAGRIGEIWLRGPGIGRGYWGRPEATSATFAARLADGGDGDWLRTGDLGALLDGELFITGRLKELLIVHGRNVAPQDVEQEARAAHHALGGQLGAAFGVAAPDERIVLVHEVDPRTPPADLPGVASAVTRRLTVSFGVPVRNVVLVRRGTVRRTTSGKIKRMAMRERFLAGNLTALHAELEPALRDELPAGSPA